MQPMSTFDPDRPSRVHDSMFTCLLVAKPLWAT